MPLTPQQRDAILSAGIADGLPDNEIADLIREAEAASAPADPFEAAGLARLAKPTQQLPTAGGFEAPRVALPARPDADRSRFSVLANALPVLLDPGVYAQVGIAAGKATVNLGVEAAANPKAFFDYIFRTPERHLAEGALSAPTKRLLDFVRPDALFDALVRAPLEIANDALVAVSPVVVDEQMNLRLKTREDNIAAGQRMLDNVLAFTPVPALQALVEVYGGRNAEDAIRMLEEHPEIAVGILLPLMVIAKGARMKSGAHPAARFDTLLRDFAEREQRQGFTQHVRATAPHERAARAEAAYAAAVAKLREHVDATVPDPALNLATRILLKPTPEGGLASRTIGEAIADIFPRRDVLLPEEAARQDALARLRAVLAEATQPRKPVVGEPTPRTRPVAGVVATESVPVGEAVLAELRGPTLAVEPARVRPGAISARPLAELRPAEQAILPGRRQIGPREGPPARIEGPALRPERLAPASVRRGPTGVATDDVIDVVRAATAGIEQLTRGDLGIERAQPPVIAEAGAKRVAREAAARRVAETRGGTVVPAESTLLPAGPEVAAEVRKMRATSRQAAVEEFSGLVADVSLPPELAEGVARLVTSAPTEEIARLNRAVAAAKRIDPRLVVTQLERLGKTGASPPPASVVEAALRDLPEEPVTPILSLGEARDAALAAGHAIDAVERTFAGITPIEMRDTRLLRNPAELARAKGTTFSALRSYAAAKGIALDVIGDEYVARAADAAEIARIPIREADALPTLGARLERYSPAARPTRPPDPHPEAPLIAQHNRDEAGFIRLDLATAGLGRFAEKIAAEVRAGRPVNRLLDAWRRADSKLWDWELGLMSNTELARELGDRGFEMIGSVLQGVEKAQVETARLLDRIDEPLRRLGMGKRGGRMTKDAYLVADTLILTKRVRDSAAPGGSRWVAAADAATRAADLVVDPREGIPLTQVAAARAAWERLPRKARAALAEAQAGLEGVFDQFEVASLKGDVIDSRRLAEARGEVPFPVEPRDVLTARSEAQLRQRVAGGVAAPPHLVSQRRRDLPRRYSAYASHAVFDTLTGGPWHDALAVAESYGFDAQRMANELSDAMRATPFAPVTIRGVQYGDRTAALRALLPGISNADLGAFIRSASGGIARAHADANRVVGLLKKDVFVRYLQERLRQEAPEGASYRGFLTPYVASMMTKIHVEPALKYATSLLSTVADDAMRARAAAALNRVAGHRFPQPTGALRWERRLSAITSALYKGTLLAKPAIAAANLTQFFTIAVPDLMVGKGAARPWEMVRLLRRSEFRELVLDMGLVEEAMPYSSYRNLNKLDPRTFIDSWRRMATAPNPRAFAAALNDAQRAGLRFVDFMAMTEVLNRKWTAAASLIKRSREMGLDAQILEGRFTEIPDSTWHALRSRMAVDVGNANFFMGRGSNQVAWIGHINERLPVATKPLLPFTSYPLNASGWILHALRDIRRGAVVGTPEARRAAIKLAAFAGMVTMLVGPMGIVPTTKWIDEEAGAKGAFTAFMREWQTRYNLVGLLGYGMGRTAQAITGEGSTTPPPTLDLASRVGVSAIPALSIPTQIGTGSFSVDRAFEDVLGSAILTSFIFDPVRTATAAGARVAGREPTAEQAEGARRLLGLLAPRLGLAETGSNVGPIPPDIAIFLPATDAINRYVLARDAHDAEARLPGARLDERGRLIRTRTATEEIMGAFGPLLGERVSRERTTRLKELDRTVAAEKQRLVRSIIEGNQAQAFKSLDRLTELAPTFRIDPAEMRASLRDEAKKRVLDFEERVFTDLSDAVARVRTEEALRHLTDAGWLRSADSTQRVREWTILLLARQRFGAKPPTRLAGP